MKISLVILVSVLVLFSGLQATLANTTNVITLLNGDVVDNNEVDFADINAVREAYGSFPGDDDWNPRADVDGSGEVDFTDINIVRSNYGQVGE
jgi:hypothetical protein